MLWGVSYFFLVWGVWGFGRVGGLFVFVCWLIAFIYEIEEVKNSYSILSVTPLAVEFDIVSVNRGSILRFFTTNNKTPKTQNKTTQTKKHFGKTETKQKKTKTQNIDLLFLLTKQIKIKKTLKNQ